MRYPFSGILVRYLPVSQEKCCGHHTERNEAESLSPDKRTQPSGKVPDTDEGSAQATSESGNENGEQRSVLLETYLPDELHVNLWEMGKHPVNPFMDIGVMIGNRASVGHLVVDLPWSVELKDISDLGARLNGEKSVAAIFNEVVHYDGFAEGNFANISFRKNNSDVKPFSLLRLNSQHFESIKMYLSDGSPASRLTIKIPSLLSTIEPKNIRKSAYIRFRIRNIPEKVYTNVFSQKDRTLISSTTETRIVDFRINVRRGIPEELLSGDERLYFPEFDKIHCFLTTERSEECISQSQNYSGYRSLMDEDVWNEYVRLDTAIGISAENSVRNYLGYQWTAASEVLKNGQIKKVKDLIVLGRFSKVKSDATSIIRFVFLVIILGAAGSGSWEIAKDLYSGQTGNFERLLFFILAAGAVISTGYILRRIRGYLKAFFS